MMEEQDRAAEAGQTLESLRLRLLDLTARNRLINFRHSRGASLRIIDELPDQLASTLLDEREMSFRPVPEPSEQELLEQGYLKYDAELQRAIRLRREPDAAEWAAHLGLATSYEMPLPDAEQPPRKHRDRAIQTLLYGNELESRLKTLLRASEAAIQEMGANILYLAFGFLQWFDDNSEKPRLAPLYLLPVRLRKGRLNRRTGSYEYRLAYSGEDLIPNLSLREKLRVDFGLALPDLEEGMGPEAYFQAVQALVAQHQPRWRLRRYLTLALLNFSRLLMYLDLDPKRWPEGAGIHNHPVARRFLAGYQAESGQSPPDSQQEYAIDQLADVHQRYPLIDAADSSQHSALIDVIDGRDLVIEGPPGTGKSQTITNLIAAAMAQGKRVLFVAEKLAALEVVRRRLDAAGLGQFCLELHSHKSNKRKVLDEIGARLKQHGKYRPADQLQADIDRYQELQQQLRSHVERVNAPWKRTGLSCHQILMAATGYRLQLNIDPEALHPLGVDGEQLDPAARHRLEDQVASYAAVYRAVAEQFQGQGRLQAHPWHGVNNAELRIFDLDEVSSLLHGWQHTLGELLQQRQAMAQTLACEPAQVGLTVDDMADLLADLERIPPLDGQQWLPALPRLDAPRLTQLRRWQAEFMSIQQAFDELETSLGGDVQAHLVRSAELSQAVDALMQLAAPAAAWRDIQEIPQRLTRLGQQIAGFEDAMTGVRQALGASAEDFLGFTRDGLQELATIIELAASLEPALWPLRDPRFDDDALDGLLKELTTELDDLHAQGRQLEARFRLDTLPSAQQLQQLHQQLSQTSWLRWFKGDWWAARRELRQLGVAGVGLAELQAGLDDVLQYARRCERLQQRQDFQRGLGDAFRGLDTDAAALQALRDWYRRVRQRYGVGFGRKVALGEALLTLADETGRALRSLAQRGLVEQISQALAELDRIAALLPGAPQLGDGHWPVLDETTGLQALGQRLYGVVERCAPLLHGYQGTVEQAAALLQRIPALQEAIELWQAQDLDGQLFDGRLHLRPGADGNNSAGLAMLEATLQLAECLRHELTHQPLVQAILENPHAELFQQLKRLQAALQQALTEAQQARAGLGARLQLDFDAWAADSGNELQALQQRNQSALRHLSALPNWLDFVRQRQQMEQAGLQAIARAAEQQQITAEQLQTAFRAGTYDLLAREILREQPELERFSGRAQEAVQAQFRDYDERLRGLQRQQIAWRIDQAEIPAGKRGARVADLTERALLEHECAKKTRHIPIRQLLKRAGRALQALKPCFMMGPMSVAQYLAPGRISFDLVVMDEASQIKPQDALGAIARGAQLVVVGDPRQLPPTSFFDRMVEEDEDDDTTGIEESESILDATLSMFPTRRLRWHYRSRHQSLIDFSNQSFYGGDLVLFPSPYNDDPQFGIRYFRVRQGCFVNRRNLEEANIIAQAVREHYAQAAGESLGVVAMSAEQRLQIERAIESLARDDERFREQMETANPDNEPLFIKNLENVQGDERDVIFISMTYGPREPGGRVAQRFGPINTDVGWRRLNVLFTRSRKRMQIFSSMGSEDIRLGDGSKRGVRALRDFLAYCETGRLHADRFQHRARAAGEFEAAVSRLLQAEGFDSRARVGSSGLFIDLGVLDRQQPGRYLLGIESDGDTYASAATVRDRDHLREVVLRRLGWNLRRIWATDWYRNPAAELEPVLRMLKDASPAPAEPPPSAVAELVSQADALERSLQPYLRGDDSLIRRLQRFDEDIIRPEMPGTPKSQRLLRPAMLEALAEFRPLDKMEYREKIPSWLRDATDPAEAQYLEAVFAIINAASASDDDR